MRFSTLIVFMLAMAGAYEAAAMANKEMCWLALCTQGLHSIKKPMAGDPHINALLP